MDEPGISIAKFPQGNGAMDDELKKVRLKVRQWMNTKVLTFLGVWDIEWNRVKWTK